MPTILLRAAACATLCAALAATAACTAAPSPAESATASATLGEARPGSNPPVLVPDMQAMHRAVAASLPFLRKEGTDWMDGTTKVQDGTGCVSCHQVPFTLWAAGEAERAAIRSETPPWDDLLRRAVEHALTPGDGRPAIFAPLRLAEGAPLALSLPEADTELMLRQLADQQESDGRWRARGQFPTQRRPIAETDAVITMWTLLSLPTEADPATVESRNRALRWLDGSKDGESTEWVLARMLLADRFGEPERRNALLGDLERRQNEDGGWGFFAEDPSDPMTTGQALYALASMKQDPAETTPRGVGYLLGSQQDGGDWEVPSRFFSTKPSDRADYVYGVWGTGWAAIGLARVASAASRREQEP